MHAQHNHLNISSDLAKAGEQVHTQSVDMEVQQLAGASSGVGWPTIHFFGLSNRWHPSAASQVAAVPGTSSLFTAALHSCLHNGGFEHSDA